MPANGPGSWRVLEIKEVPETIRLLREELNQPWNAALRDAAFKGDTFEECLGIIAHQLGIILDGNYHIPKLCGLLLYELRKKRLITIH